MVNNTSSEPIELVYSEVDGVSISMDIYIPSKASKGEPAPILLWWHGGGLLQGTRKALAPHTRGAPSKHNLCIVSVDYRLAPQTRLPGIMADCKAAIDFIQSEKFREVTGNRVDASRLIVSGSSAGGWLALLAGTGIGFEASGVKPPEGITGIAAIYPITDLLDPFWSTKHRPVVYLDRIIPDSEMATFADPNSEKTSWSDAAGPRRMFYHYMVQEAILVKLLLDGTGVDPEAYSIAQNVRAGKVKAIPPTYVITGNKDTKVPHQQSLDVVAAYKSTGINIEYHELEGLDHRFDDDENERMESMYTFVGNITRGHVA